MSFIYASPVYAAYDLLITAIDLTRACCAHELHDAWISVYSSALNGSRGIADYLFLAAIACHEQTHGGVSNGVDPFVIHESLADILVASKPLCSEELRQAVDAAVAEAQQEEKFLPTPSNAFQNSIHPRNVHAGTESPQPRPEATR
ncbi:MAG TPA: hypothetical protein VLI55_12430 [Bryobacteraceae bacterium]|nr:hypothetical protein [Bryobacteraceae bacterium]